MRRRRIILFVAVLGILVEGSATPMTEPTLCLLTIRSACTVVFMMSAVFLFYGGLVCILVKRILLLTSSLTLRRTSPRGMARIGDRRRMLVKPTVINVIPRHVDGILVFMFTLTTKVMTSVLVPTRKTR